SCPSSPAWFWSWDSRGRASSSPASCSASTSPSMERGGLPSVWSLAARPPYPAPWRRPVDGGAMTPWSARRQRCAAICTSVAMCVSIAAPAVTEATAAAAAATKEVSERTPRWGHYRDRNFGLEFDFPAHIFSLKSAEEGREGVTFSSADGRARIRVFGVPNVANDTPARYLRRI